MPQAFTGIPNALNLTPVSGVVRAHLYAHFYRHGVNLGHSRSRPAELDSTFRPQFVKPATATERPIEAAPTVRPLEPSRVPGLGAIPG